MSKVFDGRWQNERLLSEGGQAHTFLVRKVGSNDTELFVLKRLKNMKRFNRFEAELRAVQNLRHPNVVTLVDFNLSCAEPYIVFEYCKGGTLEELVKTGGLTVNTAFRYFNDVCSGLEHAHAVGIIHRDIKPANILLRANGGPAVVADFGICFIEDDGQRATATEEAAGSRLYIAPEMEDGRASTVTGAADVYSLGKVLYFMLSSGRIFSREQHRTTQFDLKGKNDNSIYGWNNLYLEHANCILDLMLCHSPGDRRDISNIAILARRACALIEGAFNPISANVPQPCRYCGIGEYISHKKLQVDVESLGITIRGRDVQWRIMVCNHCGHVQYFRDDLSEQPWENNL